MERWCHMGRTTGRKLKYFVQERRNLSFITTPIFYANGPPHLGHLYSLVLADAAHRFQQIRDSESSEKLIFSTGTDEHGIKIHNAAKSMNTSVHQHTESISGLFRSLCKDFNVSHTDFIRTTEQRHHISVAKFWEHLESKDHIYKSHYEGWYSITDEAFVPESQLTEKVDTNGQPIKVSSETGNSVEWASEENYMFKLQNLSSEVARWIQKENPIQPKQFVGPVMKWLEESTDLSISRPTTRMTWGIPVPNDPSQLIYVWMDALVNYLTVGGYPQTQSNFSWPPSAQVVGKDILKFHAIYWPAFLIAAGLEPPRKILCHSHWTVNNVKMSKSLGNIVDPFELRSRYGVEAIRYFLLREGVPHSDGNFNEEKLIRVANAELADTFGNLLSRCSSKALNPAQIWPELSEDYFSNSCSKTGLDLKNSVESLPDKVEQSYADFNFYRGLEHIMGTLRTANLFMEEQKPWERVKISPRDPSLLSMTSFVMETLRVTGTLLQPIIPTLSTQLLDRLNVPRQQRYWNHLRPFLWDSANKERMLQDKSSILFQRIRA